MGSSLFSRVKSRQLLKSAHTEGLVPATSPGDQVPSCELPIFTRKSSRRDQILVPATCLQTMFEFVGQVAGIFPLKLCWSLRVNCSWDKSLRPNEKLINHKHVNNVLRRLRD